MTDTVRATRTRFAAEVDAVREFIADTAHNSGDAFTALDYYRAASALRTLADTAERIADAYSGGIVRPPPQSTHSRIGKAPTSAPPNYSPTLPTSSAGPERRSSTTSRRPPRRNPSKCSPALVRV